MRAGVLTMGPLARYPKSKISCPRWRHALGIRDTSWHLSGFKNLGANNTLNKGYVNISSKNGLKGNIFKFPKAVTEVQICHGLGVYKGEHILKNISIEPEVKDLIKFLNPGARIKFIGKRSLKIIGIDELINGDHTIIGDRIEAFSYLCVAAITNGRIK